MPYTEPKRWLGQTASSINREDSMRRQICALAGIEYRPEYDRQLNHIISILEDIVSDLEDDIKNDDALRGLLADDPTPPPES